ncbi:MAG TPA: XRE family transcriptional regulator [Anaerolineaceae bacterium]|nr:XRE family transcriptional regulator [Anaerolineaceae bacterium]
MRLRILRLNRCFSMKKLAKLSGLSINTLSLIENDKTSPSIATLQQLAKALEVPITALFAPEPIPQKVVYTSHFSRSDAPIANARIENLGIGLARNAVQPFVITLERGAGSGESMVVHTGHEFVYVLSGRLLYLIEDKPYLLDPNDSLVFESHLPHRWKNIGEGETQILLILVPTDEHEDPGGHHFNPDETRKEKE